jgi:hypothetical protein
VKFADGDRVTGVPANENMRKEHPTVTGYYENHKWTFGNEQHSTEFIVVDDIPVDCDEIRFATRRDKDTMLS